MSAFSTIPEYIATFDSDKQAYLNKVYKLIKRYVPTETTETISYKIPTFRYNGNLIHFALFKNHLGLYPGAETIEHFKDQLQGYKISKGTIQIPLDIEIPKTLIHDLIDYNVAKLKDKKGPNWHLFYDKWTDAEEFMQQLIVKTNLIKTFKWGTYVYTYNGKNVIGWGGFKDFFSLWFYNGVFLEDPEKVLISASEGKTKALRQWRFTNVKDMDEQKILAFINESIQTIKDGKEIKPAKPTVKKADGLLKTTLENDKTLKKAFDSLTPGKQKEYIEYISEAKQEKTKLSRLEKIKPLILDNKGLNDKYKTK